MPLIPLSGALFGPNIWVSSSSRLYFHKDSNEPEEHTKVYTALNPFFRDYVDVNFSLPKNITHPG